jgi:hypothetical protein
MDFKDPVFVKRAVLGTVAAIIILGTVLLGITLKKSVDTIKQGKGPTANVEAGQQPQEATANAPVKPRITHIKTPNPMRAIYMTSWVAGIPSWRNKLIQFIKDTDVNSIVIDVKDYSGHISFETNDPDLKEAQEIRIKDLPELIRILHEAGIYTIARVTVFQDPLFAQKHPQLAVQTHAGTIWRDRNNLAYIDPSAKPFWDYILKISKACERAGFDEINVDYVRFPTDGNMKDMVFPVTGALVYGKTTSSNAVTSRNPIAMHKLPKARALKAFFAYFHQQTRTLGIPISADLFGMVLTSTDDLNIGQVLEVASPYFDAICPMIYPSHYPPGFKNFSNPAQHPYEIVNFVLKSGMARLKHAGQDPNKLRPWLQDFNLGAVYDSAKVRAQHQATYDAGLKGWLMWDPRNKYTRGGYADAGATVTRSKPATANAQL